MPDYDNTNSGALFKNKKKTAPGGNPQWPDYKGSINIDGVEYWLSAWIKEARSSGEKFMSLSVEPKEKPKPAAQDGGPGSRPLNESDDDIPF